MIEGLFSCPIGVYELGRDLSKDEMNYLKSIEMEKNTGISTTSDDVVSANTPSKTPKGGN